MKMGKKSKVVFSILPVLGILLLLIGYWFLISSVFNVSKELGELELKKDTLELEIEKLEKEKVIKENYYENLTEEIKKKGDPGLIEKTNELNLDMTTELNAVNSQLSLDLDDGVKIVYIHVNNQSVKEKMRQASLIEKLKEQNYQVFGYDVQEGRANNQIRYFHQEDIAFVKRLDSLLVSIDGNLKLSVKFIDKFQSRVPRGQVELWIE